VLPPDWRALNLGKRSCPRYTILSQTRRCTPLSPSVKPPPWLLSPKYHDIDAYQIYNSNIHLDDRIA
jgi:hypothetical protein